MAVTKPHPNPCKDDLAASGAQLVSRFCELNDIAVPSIVRHDKSSWHFDACAYYRPTTINICVPRCASVGVAGRAWSYPGYVIDRTPYGVMAHELGHHVDVLWGKVVDRYRSNFSAELRRETGDEKITNYCPDDGEWFAEIFRLYVTNPDLLAAIRPRTYGALFARGLKPVWSDSWRDRLAFAPARTIAQCERRIAETARASGRKEVRP